MEYCKTSPDRELSNKALLSWSLHEETFELIHKFAKHNPVLGTIPNCEMRIELRDESPFRRLPLLIPVKLLKKAKAEMMKKIGWVLQHSYHKSLMASPYEMKYKNLFTLLN